MLKEHTHAFSLTFFSTFFCVILCLFFQLILPYVQRHDAPRPLKEEAAQVLCPQFVTQNLLKAEPQVRFNIFGNINWSMYIFSM